MYQRRRIRKRKTKLLKMGDFLPRVLKKKNILLDMLDQNILGAWRKAVGPQILAQTAPFKFKNDTLFVNVSTPAWMQQLRFMKQEIMDKVNSEGIQKEIKNIHFMIGDIPSAPAPPEDPAIDFNPRLLKERDKRLIKENLSQVGDKELKGILKRVMTREIIKRRLNG
ncbi:MAG: DUF721 domain-containing protein [Deltaproteobacteria bacterium]|nr:DUF721 domain-containing protein [Deltaproteobacteria bacterium]